jgi:hypothetical protein
VPFAAPFRLLARILLVSVFLYCQHISGVSILLVSVFLWCQYFSGVSISLVSVFLWCQYFSGVSISLVSVFLWCQYFSGVSISLVPLYIIRKPEAGCRKSWPITLKVNCPGKPVFAVITTVVKYVRTVLHQTGHFARHDSTKLRCQYVRYRSTCTIQMINLYGQDVAKTFYQERELISWHSSSNLFDRFDLYFYVDIY